jgi:hypothetical protein
MSYGGPAGAGGYGPYGVPQSVNIASTILFITGALNVLGGIIALTIIPAIGAVVLVFAALVIYIGLQLRKLIPWARIGAIVIGVIAIVLGVASFRAPLTLIINVLMGAALLYLMFRPDTLSAFPQGSGRRR